MPIGLGGGRYIVRPREQGGFGVLDTKRVRFVANRSSHCDAQQLADQFNGISQKIAARQSPNITREKDHG